VLVRTAVACARGAVACGVVAVGLAAHGICVTRGARPRLVESAWVCDKVGAGDGVGIVDGGGAAARAGGGGGGSSESG
jgi:hypothetical protein